MSLSNKKKLIGMGYIAAETNFVLFTETASGKTTLAEQMKIADDKGLQCVVVGSGGEYGKYAETIAKMAQSGKVHLVPIHNLKESEQEILMKRLDEQERPNIEEIKIKFEKLYEPPVEHSENYLRDLEKKPLFAGFKRTKLKGYQKNRKKR